MEAVYCLPGGCSTSGQIIRSELLLANDRSTRSLGNEAGRPASTGVVHSAGPEAGHSAGTGAGRLVNTKVVPSIGTVAGKLCRALDRTVVEGCSVVPLIRH